MKLNFVLVFSTFESELGCMNMRLDEVTKIPITLFLKFKHCNLFILCDLYAPSPLSECIFFDQFDVNKENNLQVSHNAGIRCFFLIANLDTSSVNRLAS